MTAAVSLVTRPGWTLLALSTLALVAGYGAHYSVLVAFGVMGWLLLAFATTAVVLRPTLTLERSVEPARVTAGERAALGELSVRNTSRRPSLPQVGRDQIGDRTLEVGLPALGPKASKTFRYALPTDRRAVVDVGPFTVRQSDPFGLLVRERSYGGLVVLFVHPRRHSLDQLPPSRRLSLDGPTSEQAPRGSTTFHAIRQYVPGDDRRHIHWKLSARTGGLMVRQLVDTSEPSLVLLLDVTRDHYRHDDDFEAAVEVVASLAEAGSRDSFPVLVVTTAGARWAARREEPDVLLDHLAGVQMVGDDGLEATVRDLLVGPRQRALVVVGAAFDHADRAAVGSLRSHFDHTTVISVGGASETVDDSHSILDDGAQFASWWNASAMR